MIMARAALDVRTLTAAAAGRVIRGNDAVVCGTAWLDSRTIQPGAMFVAYRGPNFDGHDFIGQAIARGAAAVLVESADAVAAIDTGAVPVILVANTERGLQDMALAIRRASGARVVAITGSAGKTTTKDAVATVLEARYRTLRTKGNFNNHLGLPLSLFDLQAGHDVAVLELGMSGAGEIRRLVEVAEPDVRVWTNVGTAHIGYFGSMDAIAEAKAEILEGATAESVLIANADDALVMRHAPRFAGRVVTFGEAPTADVRATSIRERGVDGVTVMMHTPRGAAVVSSVLIGRAHVSNLMAAVAVGLELGVPLASMPGRIASLAPAAHRGEVLRLGGDVVVVDDCYNASPSAVVRMLEACGRDTSRRYVACLGEMLELGDQAHALHADVARAAQRAGVQVLVTVGGGPAQHLADEAVRAGLAAGAVHHVADSVEAARLATDLVRDGDLVLVKGSRGIKMERVVDGVREARG
ncbi:MAG: UDP-N-acetylmuramoyl-tripeptide--D-alanyl-D-alanine ligase [Acidobacteria bacterium]|nr:UDP-N-acetylmuramoyl-tripeptide--D-alanyl-D-alanine ligase [Acidobacteriota bacterium]